MEVRERMEELVRAEGEGTLRIGRHGVAADGAPQWEARLREALTRRFFERRPHATDATWHRFEAQLNGYVRGVEAVSDRVEGELLALIDAL